jgi:hypothetical protein
MPINLPRCAVALACANVTYQGGTQAPNYHEIADLFTVPRFPAALDRMFAVYEFKDGVPGVYRTKLRIEGPNAFLLDQPTMDISFTTELYNVRVAIELRQFTFPTIGRYKFALYISNEEAGFFTLDLRQATPGPGFSSAPRGQSQ